MNYKNIINLKGFSFLEIAIVIGLMSLMFFIIGFSAINYKRNTDLEGLESTLAEKICRTKSNALRAKLDDNKLRTAYGVKILPDRIIEFTGSSYVESSEANIVYNLPSGTSLDAECNPSDNGEIVFLPLSGENSNYCNIFVYQSGDLKKTYYVGKYGIENVS